MREAVDAVAPNDTPERFAGLGVRVIAGEARFRDAHTVAVGGFHDHGAPLVIATGSSAALPAIPGPRRHPACHQRDHIPAHRVSAAPDRHRRRLGQSRNGAGIPPAGLPQSPCSRRPRRLQLRIRNARPSCSTRSTAKGIKLRSGIEIAGCRVLARVEVDIVTPGGAETIAGSHLLVAAGRRPNIEDLDLDAAGIRYAPGGIVVDQRLRTTNKRVYAVGDVTIGSKSTHLANYHAELVVRHALFRQRVSVDQRTIPNVTHTDPELAQVGFLEDEARVHAGAIRVLRWPYRDNDRAQCTQATQGHIKVITDRRGDILGVTIVGAAASENIATWALAIAQKLNIAPLPASSCLSGLCRGGKTRRHDLFHAGFDEFPCASHHRVAAPSWLIVGPAAWLKPMTDETAARPDSVRVPRFGLSGKLLVLTILFVMIAEVLIYVPSIANFRLTWLKDHLATAYTAALELDVPQGAAPGIGRARQADSRQHRRPRRRHENGRRPPHACGERYAAADCRRFRHAQYR